ncbi:MAG: glycine cleavage system protein GcvH [Candidatus Tritonobacter lacicola]|nr:glycine cleavage system protein GcvH [Candidatus Tritonobacter lacicola]
MDPKTLRFTGEHEWIEAGKTGAKVGLSDYAQEELSDIVYVEFPPIGKKVAKGETLVILESVKATSEVYAPVNGEVTNVNNDLEQNPQKINDDPYGEGWLVEMEISDPAQLSELMDDHAYQDYLKQEELN